MKAIIFLICLLTFSAATQIQGQIQGQVKEDAPLRYTISSGRHNICLGQSVKFTRRITNITKNPVVIEKNFLGYSSTIGQMPKAPAVKKLKSGGYSGGEVSGTMARHSTGDPGPGYKPQYIVLRPGESYQANSEYTFGGDKFFERGRGYKARFTYGHFFEEQFQGIPVWRGTADSNEVKISIRNCRK
jgi:hypothetical protein